MLRAEVVIGYQLEHDGLALEVPLLSILDYTVAISMHSSLTSLFVLDSRIDVHNCGFVRVPRTTQSTCGKLEGRLPDNRNPT